MINNITKTTIIFLFINFVVSFISDIVLNDLSTNFGIIISLRSYFQNQSIIKSGVNAGITIIIALLLNMLLSFFLFGVVVPTNFNMLIKFCTLAFIIGYVMDIFIYKMKIFDNRLDAYYKVFGSGFWGAIAFIFSIIISYFIQNNILPIL